MKIKPYDFHTHSLFCDGKNTLEEMVLAVIDKGFSAIGFSGHSYTHFDLECGIPDEKEAEYFGECRKLQKKYNDKIDVFCGIERDFYADNEYPDTDYVIGSVHYLKVGEDNFLAVDMDKETQINGVNEYFGGDFLSFAECYFDTVSKLPEVHKTDIIGHFDLIKIFNADGMLFDETNKRYKDAAIKAVDKLLAYDVLFEVNSGAVFRGRRNDPYPSVFILKHIASKGGKVILSGDSHEVKALGFNFDKSLELIKRCGFKSVYTITNDGKKELEF
ncbi:MAG: histidinol-phosphatase HisJ family protein [Ruminococcaceae bacterium]|nr:histidinol-phosphatase HisJ family protein [Oscillospiraceae bacterium]